MDEGASVSLREYLREGGLAPGIHRVHGGGCGENQLNKPKSLMLLVEAGGVEPPSHGRSSSRDYMLIRRRVFRSTLTLRLDGRRVVRM